MCERYHERYHGIKGLCVAILADIEDEKAALQNKDLFNLEEGCIPYNTKQNLCKIFTQINYSFTVNNSQYTISQQ
jgi:hypothetical protein